MTPARDDLLPSCTAASAAAAASAITEPGQDYKNITEASLRKVQDYCSSIFEMILNCYIVIICYNDSDHQNNKLQFLYVYT